MLFAKVVSCTFFRNTH